MKSTTLLLCCLLALSFVGCRGTTEAERMPVSADTIGKMLGDADLTIQTFPLLQELQDAGILAEHAAMSER